MGTFDRGESLQNAFEAWCSSVEGVENHDLPSRQIPATGGKAWAPKATAVGIIVM